LISGEALAKEHARSGLWPSRNDVRSQKEGALHKFSISIRPKRMELYSAAESSCVPLFVATT
jgi:hypothetical protein